MKIRVKVTATHFLNNLNPNNMILVVSGAFYGDLKYLQHRISFLYASTDLVNFCIKLNLTECNLMWTRLHSEPTARTTAFLMAIHLQLVK